MSLTLVALAAGRGARFGGWKQLARLGPDGETLLDYLIFDAHRAGFARFVLVVQQEMQEDFAPLVENWRRKVQVDLVFQDGATLPAGRDKPWGTAHALLAAEPQIPSSFAVANADDFYGISAIESLAAFLRAPQKDADCALVTYSLEKTLSSHGGVRRALVRARDGWLTEIDEVGGIERGISGIVGVGRAGPMSLRGAERVSMNLWGFRPSILAMLREHVQHFLELHSADREAECLLPEAVNKLVTQSHLRVRTLESDGNWLGVTYRADAAHVAASLQALVEAGSYPRNMTR